MKSDSQLEEMLYDFAFSQDYASREQELFSRLGRKYRAGEVVVREGDSSSQLYLIISGSLKIVKGMGTPEEKAIAALMEGEILGEMSYFDNMPRSASVIAVVDSELLVLDHEHFDMIFQLHPKWTLVIVQTLANRIYLAYLDLINRTFMRY